MCQALLTAACIAVPPWLAACTDDDGHAGIGADSVPTSPVDSITVDDDVAADDVAASDLARSLLDGMTAVMTGTAECVRLTETSRPRAAPGVEAAVDGASTRPELRRLALEQGLRVVYAVATEDRDYESSVEVMHTDEAGVTLNRIGRDGDSDRRRVLRDDLDHARCFAFNYSGEPGVGGPGLTWLSLSRSLLTELRDAGAVEFGVANESVPPSRRFATFVGQLRRVGTGTFTLMLDDSLVTLPSIAARAEVRHGDALKEFDVEFLDDLSLPLLLKACCVRSADHVVRIERRDEQRIERALAENGRAIVYGIQFDFGSADLRADSEQVLDEIADILQRNPDWRVRVDGHTDAIGDTQSNLELSRRRAASVRDDLVRRLGPDAADRIETGGFGESRPRADNETLAGRAANRRVELTRSIP